MSENENMTTIEPASPDYLAENVEKAANAQSAILAAAGRLMVQQGISGKEANVILLTAAADAYARQLVMSINPEEVLEVFERGISTLRKMVLRYAAVYNHTVEASVSDIGHA